MSEAIRASFDRIAAQYAADFADELTRKPWDAERLRRFAAACAPGQCSMSAAAPPVTSAASWRTWACASLAWISPPGRRRWREG